MPAQARRVLPGKPADEATQIWIFPSRLGFMALVQQQLPQQFARQTRRAKPKFLVKQLTIAHASPTDALVAVDSAWRFHAEVQNEPNSLVRRLQAYAEGAEVDFDDVEVDFPGVSAFRRRVIAACRAIPRGETRTYGEVALDAGAPRAARAVGTTMATCRVSIIVPCHRVVGSGGKLGGYSPRTGLSLKSRLLELEKSVVSSSGGRRIRRGASRRPNGR